MIYLRFLVDKVCSDFNGVPMLAKNRIYSQLDNHHVCCPRKCHLYCDECNGNAALQPEYCSIHNDNMCYQGLGSIECCTSSIYKTCHLGKVNAPCRLSK